MLFLKYEILNGNLTLQDYAQYLEIMKDFINENRQNYTDIFTKHIDLELEVKA